MENLGQIKSVRDKIKIESRSAIQMLYKLKFEQEGNRTSRRKWRKFSGLTFRDNSKEYRAKFEYSNTFSIGDLMSICNIFGLCYAGSREKRRVRVIRVLMNINNLITTETPDDGEEEESDDCNDDHGLWRNIGNRDIFSNESDNQFDNDGPVLNRRQFETKEQ